MRREAAAHLIAQGVSERAACRTVGLHRWTFQYGPRAESHEDAELRAEIRALARRHRRYGYRRITALLRRAGRKVNPKRTYRIWKAEGLILPRKRPKRRRYGLSVERPHRAQRRGHVWTYDFAFDRTETNRVLKMLIVLDEFTRECHRIRVELRLDSRGVIETLKALFALHGAPGFLRSDNGPEFIADAVQQWLTDSGTRTIYIEPGHPWENGFAESFVGKFRDECLNEEVFWSREEAQIVVETWRIEYNERRPHSSLGYRTPSEAAQWLAPAASSVGPLEAPAKGSNRGMD